MIKIINKSNQKLHSKMKECPFQVRIMEDELGNISVCGIEFGTEVFKFTSKIPEVIFEAMANELCHLYVKDRE